MKTRRAGRHLARLASAVLVVLACGACGDDASPPPVSTGDRDASQDAALDGEAPIPDAAGFDGNVIPPPVDGGRRDAMMPPLDDDAEVADCAQDCSLLETACRNAYCDPNTLECVIEPKADGLACGSQELSTCTAPDMCQDGVCQPRHAAEDTPCGDQGHECRLDDACDGEGRCVDRGLRAVGTPCGDSSSSQCDAADTCNALGECDDNHAPLNAPCGDQDVVCRYDDVCDGNGSCVDQGSWEPGSCPAGVEVAEDGRCGCGRPSGTSACMPGPDVCVEDECVPGHEFYAPAPLTTTNGMPCGSPADTQCDNPDICLEGFCLLNAEPEDTACGSSASSACNLADSCDGFGNCRTNELEVNTVCGEAPGPCFEPPRCNAVGLCAAGTASEPGKACGDSSVSECDGADTCDGTGNCSDNLALVDTPCGEPSAGECDADDSCNATGQCVDRVVTPGTQCGQAGGECVALGECSPEGTCVGAMNELPGTPCGDSTEGECDLSDSCDGDGRCVANFVDEGESCGGTPPACIEASECNGAGSCLAGTAIPNCKVPLKVVVTDQATSTALAGVVVSIEGAVPAESDTTNAAGEVVLEASPNSVIRLSLSPTATHWGLRAIWVVAGGQDNVAPLSLMDDATVDGRYTPTGLDPIADGTGILEGIFLTPNPNGGESMSLDPGCPAATCGPIALNGMGQYELSEDTLPGASPRQLALVSLAPGTPSVLVSGAPGASVCQLVPGQGTLAIAARTLTQLYVSCTSPTP